MTGGWVSSEISGKAVARWGAIWHRLCGGPGCWRGETIPSRAEVGWL